MHRGPLLHVGKPIPPVRWSCTDARTRSRHTVGVRSGRPSYGYGQSRIGGTFFSHNSTPLKLLRILWLSMGKKYRFYTLKNRITPKFRMTIVFRYPLCHSGPRAPNPFIRDDSEEIKGILDVANYLMPRWSKHGLSQ